MDVLFENRYTFDRPLMVEYIGFLLAPQRKIGGAIAALALLMTVLNWGRGMGYFFGACTLILLGALLLQGPMVLNRLEKVNAALHGGESVETFYQLTEEGIHLTEGETTVNIKYAQITSLHETPHLYLLVMGGQNAVMLKKDGFTVGDASELMAFVKRKTKL